MDIKRLNLVIKRLNTEGLWSVEPGIFDYHSSRKDAAKMGHLAFKRQGVIVVGKNQFAVEEAFAFDIVGVSHRDGL